MASEFLDRAGKPISFAAWQALMNDGNREIAYDKVEIAGQPVTIHTRYCGCGGSVFKTSITGVDKFKDHEAYSGHLEYVTDAATAAKEHVRIKAAIEQSKPDDLVKIPLDDQAKAVVKKQSLAAEAALVEAK